MKKIILEQEGLSDFLSELSESVPDSVYVLKFLTDFIKKSGCKNIQFSNFKITVHGASLDDRVLINRIILNQKLIYILYVILHEIAHQYQYKKYGKEKMYEIYLGKISVKDSIKWLRSVEEIADEFAFRKLRELSKTNEYVNNNYKSLKKNYENIPDFKYEKIINNVIDTLKKSDIEKTKDNISEILYNNFIHKIN